MAIVKKLVFSLVFIICALIIPALILLLLVDAAQSFAVYVIVYGIIIFGTLGYIIASLLDMNKSLKASMDEIKKQNAAIAYKITKGAVDFSEMPAAAPEKAPEVAPEPVSTANIPLNPAEPLFPQTEPEKAENVEKTKVIDDNFDDFK